MNKFKKIKNALKNCAIFKASNNKYAILSDLHLGAGDNKDSSMKNALFIFEALKYYLENDYYVILAGDTFDLAENRDIERIKRAHEDIMWVFEELHKKGRLTIIRGNHDEKLKSKMLKTRQSSYIKNTVPFLDNINIYSSAEVQAKFQRNYIIMHGHQPKLIYQPGINSIVNFFIYTIWGNLEMFFCKDFTKDIDGFDDTKDIDQVFSSYATENGCIAICGHTHSVRLIYPNYFNVGGGVLPRCITCGEIVADNYLPYKWSYLVEGDTVHIKKQLLGDTVFVNSL